jgi:HSP20 family molecular chaperone IbpA
LEIQYGVFHCAVALPYNVDAENIRAHLRNGILEIRLPRAAVGRRTAIDVIVEP